MPNYIIFDYDTLPRKKSLLDEFDDVESSTEKFTSLNEFRPSVQKEKEMEKNIQDEDEADDDWLTTLAQFKTPKVKAGKHRSKGFNFFEDESGGKKKKKKKKKEGPKDYVAEFEPDIALMRNLLEDQTKFTKSLQQRYDVMEASKTSARGVGKFTTDLIGSINQARGVSLQLINNIASLKKSAIELNMKERKELAAQQGIDPDNISDFSANFLKKIIQQDRSDAAMYGDSTPVEGDEEDLFGRISESLGESDRSDEVTKYLQYENRNVEIYAYVNENTNYYELKAVASDGEIIDDYPIPSVESLDINHSTGIATDDYHNQYKIIWT
jgi:hypothetical protein